MTLLNKALCKRVPFDVSSIERHEKVSRIPYAIHSLTGSAPKHLRPLLVAMAHELEEALLHSRVQLIRRPFWEGTAARLLNLGGNRRRVLDGALNKEN